MTTFSAPKGVIEYYPPTSAAFLAVRDTLMDRARRAGYGYIELPIFEDTGALRRAASASRPTWSARRCTPSTTGATDP